MENLIHITYIHGVILMNVFAVVIILLLVSHNKRRLQELETAREEFSKLCDLKNSLIFKMSDEIRTNIDYILDMTKFILFDSNNVNDYTSKINEAGKLLQTLAEVLKIESDRIDCLEDKYHVSVLIQEISEFGAEYARKHDLGFCIETDERHPSALLGDISLIKQVISCFLDNAVKYTKSGQITLRFSFKEIKDKDEVILCISVADTGIGIKDEHINKLTENFAKYNSTLDNGIGHGLFIAKKLTDRMKGRIFVESEYGNGSRFWVEFPQTIVSRKPMGDWRLADDLVS